MVKILPYKISQALCVGSSIGRYLHEVGRLKNSRPEDR